MANEASKECRLKSFFSKIRKDFDPGIAREFDTLRFESLLRDLLSFVNTPGSTLSIGPTLMTLGSTLMSLKDVSFDVIVNSCQDLALNKNSDYSIFNIAATGQRGCAIRACDKIARALTLSQKKASAIRIKDESFTDSLQDCFNYILFIQVLEEGLWLSETERQVWQDFLSGSSIDWTL